MPDNNLNSPSEIEARREIRRLTVENRRLTREIDALKNEIDELEDKSSRRSRLNKYQTSLKRCAENEYMFSKRNSFSFLLTQLKFTSFFQIYRRALTIFRRYSFITTSLKVFSIIFLFVEASILVLISTSAFIMSLIFTLFISQLFTFFTLLTRKRYNRRNTELMRGKSVCIFFPTKERAFDYDSFFQGFVREEANKENSVAVIVSPYLFNSVGLEHSKKIYYYCREDGENILLVRKRYYFTLRKKVISQVASNVTEIY